MKLTTEGFKAVYDALDDAFISSTDYEQIAHCLGYRLADTVHPDSALPKIIIAMIERAEAADGVEKLVACARKLNGDNPLLAAVSQADLVPATTPQEVAKEGSGTQDFKRRLVETLAQLDTPGFEVVAAKELSDLLAGAADGEALTFYLAMVGTVRGDRPPEVVDELTAVFAAALRRCLGALRSAGSEVDLARAHLPRIDLSDLDLHEADLAFADLTHANLGNVNLWRSASYGVDVSRADLSRSNLEEARWHAAIGRGAKFQDCRMVSVFLKDAELAGAAFHGSRLQGAHLERADLSGAVFAGANVSDARFTGAKIDEAAARSLARAVNWGDAHLDPPVKALVERFADEGK